MSSVQCVHVCIAMLEVESLLRRAGAKELKENTVSSNRSLPWRSTGLVRTITYGTCEGLRPTSLNPKHIRTHQIVKLDLHTDSRS